MRQLLAVLTGYVSMAFLLLITQLLLPISPEKMSPLDMVTIAVYSVLYAAVAGWLAAAIGKQMTAPVGLALLILMLRLGAVAAFRSEPIWFGVLLPLVIAAATIAAGVFRVRRYSIW